MGSFWLRVRRGADGPAVGELIVVAVLLALPLALFWQTTLGGKTLLPADNLYQWPPWASYATQMGVGIPHNELLSDRTYRKVWREPAKTTRSVNKEGLRKGGIFKFELPVQLPKTVRSIVGNGAPSIEVLGSERISILGTSDWLVRTDTYADVTGERNRQGAFPSFEMKQELNVNMTGSIGEKIKVDIDQSSNRSRAWSRLNLHSARRRALWQKQERPPVP